MSDSRFLSTDEYVIGSPDKRACDLERDIKGRIKVDITNLHILEDMSYFTKAADHFREHGVYTKLPPNPHPNSEYMRFWKEEQKRCKEGYIREEDGEWIPGYYYWYLNYCPIQRTKVIEDNQVETGHKRAERVLDFPAIWDSDYQYFHYLEQAEQTGQYGTVLKTRGRGYSFKGGAMLTRNFYHYPGSKSYAIASESEYLTKDGLLSKAWEMMDFIDENTPWSKLRQKINREMHKRASYIESKTGIEKGYKSEIIGISLKDDPEKARGKRGKLILWEEAGKFPGLLKAWQVARPSLEQGSHVFGLMIAFGTGGTEGANFEALHELFYKPKAYNVYNVPNIWDKGRETTRCGFFVPEYMSREDCYDENGNSDRHKAILIGLKNRDIIRREASDPAALVMEKAERPFTPQEAIVRVDNTTFPINKLKERETQILADPAKWIDTIDTGKLLLNEDGTVSWTYTDDQPIRQFPIKDNKFKEGCIEIFEHPQDFGGRIPFGIYIGGCDPYDDDESQTNSLGSVFIMNTLTNRIVAEYTGRPNTAKEFYEIVWRLGKYYNAIINYENDKKGMYAYFEQKHSLYMLADNPQILKDMEIQKIYGAGSNKSKGTNSSKRVNSWGRELTKTYLLEQAYNKEDGVQNYTVFRSLTAIQEMILWNPDGNFDRVSALGMLMILREDRWRHNADELIEEIEEVSDDDFFNRHMEIEQKYHEGLVTNARKRDINKLY